MNDKIEYVVVSKEGINISDIDKDLGVETSTDYIPDRAVELKRECKHFSRTTHWMLTREEAKELRKDPRIHSIVSSIENKNIKARHCAVQQNTFKRNGSLDSANWGLRRSTAKANVYGTSNTAGGKYKYALDGSNVDVVIVDTGIEPSHPEWEDSKGTSRLQKIDWSVYNNSLNGLPSGFYTDPVGHGTHCAGIATGKTYGWAKGANIYSIKLEDLAGNATGIGIYDVFDCLLGWHNNKGTGRPTVVNMSFGYTEKTVPGTDEITSGTYQGTDWNRNDDTDGTDNDVWDKYGIVSATDGIYGIPLQYSDVDAKLQELADAGMHICLAAGNSYYKADISGGDDYDNNIKSIDLDGDGDKDDNDRIYYHRPQSPHTSDAFTVGNLDSALYGNKEQRLFSSVTGPAVNIYAPGTNIVSAVSNSYDGPLQASYPEHPTFRVASMSGTSMAAPQVAGLLALYLQSMPELTPMQLKSKLFNDSTKSVLDDSGDATAYRRNDTLLGGPNRLLFSRYGKEHSFNMSAN